MTDIEKKQKSRKTIAIIEIVVFLSILILIPVFIFLKYPDTLQYFKSADAFQAFLSKYEKNSIIIYIAIQIIQTVITFIPAQAVQMAGGYMYGFLWVSLFTIIGVTIGTAIAFGIAKLFGENALRVLFGDERIDKYRGLLDSEKGHTIMIILYLIPGVPKDLLAYAAGVANLKFIPFLITSMVARFPGVCASMLTGSFLKTHNYVGLVILWIIVLATIIGFILYTRKNKDFYNKYFLKNKKKK